METKLEHDLSSVSLNGPDGDSQLRCDLLIRFPLGQEADDFTLARSYSGTGLLPLLPLAFCLEKSIQHDIPSRRAIDDRVRNQGDGFHGDGAPATGPLPLNVRRNSRRDNSRHCSGYAHTARAEYCSGEIRDRV